MQFELGRAGPGLCQETIHTANEHHSITQLHKRWSSSSSSSLGRRADARREREGSVGDRGRSVLGLCCGSAAPSTEAVHNLTIGTNRTVCWCGDDQEMGCPHPNCGQLPGGCQHCWCAKCAERVCPVTQKKVPCPNAVKYKAGTARPRCTDCHKNRHRQQVWLMLLRTLYASAQSLPS